MGGLPNEVLAAVFDPIGLDTPESHLASDGFAVTTIGIARFDAIATLVVWAEASTQTGTQVIRWAILGQGTVQELVTTTMRPTAPAVTATVDGFLMAFVDSGDGEVDRIFGLKIDPTGLPTVEPFPISEGDTSVGQPRIASRDGRAFIAYRTGLTIPQGSVLLAGVDVLNGAVLFPTLTVTGPEILSAGNLAVAVDGDLGVSVAFVVDDGNTSVLAIHRFAEDGTALCP